MKSKQSSKNIGILVLAVSVFMILFGVFALHASTAIVLLLTGITTCILLLLNGMPYRDVEVEVSKSVSAVIIPIIRLMIVGLLISMWMACGTIPYMIYMGMRFLTPRMFLPVACLLCALISTMAGTSWGALATVGVACMSIAAGMGIPRHIVAGAVVTGVLFGDKVSPMSDSVMLTSTVTDVSPIEGIASVLRSTGPAYLISLAVYFVIGARMNQGSIGGEVYTLILSSLSETFRFSPILLLPPAIMFGMILYKLPNLPAFVVGAASGGILALTFQNQRLTDVLTYLHSGYIYHSDHEILSTMMERGGLLSMLPTIALLMAACVFSTPIKCSGLIDIMIAFVQKHANSAAKMANGVLILHSIFFSMTGAYYVTIPVVASMTKELFPAYGLDKKNLMRILQDTGPGLSGAVPWGATGVYITGMLGLSSTWEYLHMAPMLWLSVIFSLLINTTGIGLNRIHQDTQHDKTDQN